MDDNFNLESDFGTFNKNCRNIREMNNSKLMQKWNYLKGQVNKLSHSQHFAM